MAPVELYLRSTTIRKCLTETLDEMVSGRALMPELATKVLVQFDKVMTEILETQVETKDSFKFNYEYEYLGDNSSSDFSSENKSSKVDDDDALMDIVTSGGINNQLFPSRSPDEGTGTTIVSVRGVDFVLFATDGRSTDRMFGSVLNDGTVKTWWLAEYIFAICSGNLSAINMITKEVTDHYFAYPVDSVQGVAQKIREKADELASDEKCSFIVVGRRSRRRVIHGKRRSTYNEIPSLFYVTKDEGASSYGIKKVDVAVGGSGKRCAKMYLNANRKKLDKSLKNRDINAIKEIIKGSIASARRDDVFTDGAINMVTVTRENTPVIERAFPLDPDNLSSAYSDWIYIFQPHGVPKRVASTFQDYT